MDDTPGAPILAPATVGGITRAWLDAVLGPADGDPEVTDLGAGVGLLGAVARVRRAGTASVVVKLPSPDPTNRAIVRRFGYDRREAGFYRDVRPGAPVPAPRCLAIAESAEGPVLVLEDLGYLRRPDQLAGADAADVRTVAGLAARIHAAFWEDPRLLRLPWLPGPTDERIAGYGALFDLCWDTAADQVGASAEERAAALTARDRFGAVVRSFADSPRTLVHGDLRLDNVLLPAGPGDHAVALDWQLAAWGRGAYDLAFFAAGSVEPAIRRRTEEAMVRHWHEALLAGGVRGYDLDRAWLDYRLGLVLNLPNPVTAAVAVTPGNERGRALLHANLRRALAAVCDHWLDPAPELLRRADAPG